MQVLLAAHCVGQNTVSITVKSKPSCLKAVGAWLLSDSWESVSIQNGGIAWVRRIASQQAAALGDGSVLTTSGLKLANVLHPHNS